MGVIIDGHEQARVRVSGNELVRLAAQARANSRCPYSHVSVGAAVLGCDAEGRVCTWSGANVENGAFGDTMCAERIAVWRAWMEGVRTFEAVAVVGGPEGESPSAEFPPCGSCRQVLSELAGPDLVVLLSADGEQVSYETRLAALLPHGFSLDRTTQVAHE